MHAVIVAGGPGTRAHALKALLPVAGTPIAVRQIRVLAREGVTHLTILAGHPAGQLQDALAPEALALGLGLDIVAEDKPLGTAGCLVNLGAVTQDTLIVHGDMLFDMALAPLHAFNRRHGALITIVAHPNDHPRTSDLLVERDGLVRAILPRKAARDGDHRNLVPAGLYLAAPAFFARLPRQAGDMIDDVLPQVLTDGGRIAAYNTPEYLRDVGSPARHAMAEQDLGAGLPEALNGHHKRPAIFFDVDGVLNHEPGTRGALKPDDVAVIPGAGEALRRTRAAHHLAIGVTNRPQVARGDISFDDLDRILGRLEALLAADHGVLDRIYFCPHHPDKGFPGEVAALKFACECRKPGTLMFRQAAAELPIDVKRSAAIGDSLRDIGAARAFGVPAYGVRTGYGCRDAKRYPGGSAPEPDLMFADVGEAVAFCLTYRKLAAPVLAAMRGRKAQERPLVVAVCGRSRSGKSVVAHALARALGEDGQSSLHVRLDDWIVPADARTPDMNAEARSRLDALPGIVRALRAGEPVTAPGYDAQTRGAARARTYDPRGRAVIILDGLFAAHRTVRTDIDLAAFVEPMPEARYKDRFRDLYRWKGVPDDAIEGLWRDRTVDEWPLIDAQRADADLVVPGMADLISTLGESPPRAGSASDRRSRAAPDPGPVHDPDAHGQCRPDRPFAGATALSALPTAAASNGPAAPERLERGRTARTTQQASMHPPVGRPRLLYLVSEDWYFLSHRLPMARAARAAGYEVHVATRVVDGGPAIEHEGFTLHPIPWKRGSASPAAALATIRTVRALYKRIRPDIVHHVAFAPAVLGSIAALGLPMQKLNALAGLGFVFTSNTPKARALRPPAQALLRFLLTRPGATVLVQNPDDRAIVRRLGVDDARIALIPGSGVDVDRLTPLPEPDAPFTAGFVGRLLYDKGVQVLVRAQEILRERGTPVRLLMAGAPDPSNPASIPAQTLQRWRQTEGVTLLGHVGDVRTVWAQAHIAVLPSRREGLPMSLLEAAACGRAMVATDVPGCREIVRHGVDGLLAPADDAEALADAIAALMRDPQLRARYAGAARQIAVDEFSTTHVAAAIVDLYARLGAGGGAP